MSATAEAALAKLTGRERTALVAQVRREVRAEIQAAEAARRAEARRTREVEPADLAAAAKRMVKALGKRAAADLEALALLNGLHAVIDEQMAASITAARRGDALAGDHRYSWADVGRVLGVTRQAAQMRYGKADR